MCIIIINLFLGSQSSDEVTQSLLEMSVYIANLFFLTSDTIVPIIKDTDLKESDASMLPSVIFYTLINFDNIYYLCKLCV